MKLTKKHLFLFLACLLICCALTFTLTALFFPRTEVRVPVPVPVEYPAVEGVPDQYRELVSLIETYSHYGLSEDLDFHEWIASAIVAATGDPYAAYFTAEEYEEYYGDLDGNFVGIGVTVDAVEREDGTDLIRLLWIFEGSGAERAGLRSGDLIIGIDGKTIEEYGSYSAALSAVAGEEGTTVSLTVLRGGETLEFPAVERATTTKQTVLSDTIPTEAGDIGYVRVTTFDGVTTRQFIGAVSALEEAGVRGFVFDLRYNGGGLLRTVCEMLAYLLPDGDICHVRYSAESLAEKSYTVSAAEGKMTGMVCSNLSPEEIGHALSVPAAVLTNDSTASASELFTSALRDYAASGEYPDFPDIYIVGENTYGKGCVQNAYRLSNGDWVKLTDSLYYPPFGDNFDGKGLAPSDGCAVEANDTRVADLFLKDTPGSLTLAGGAPDSVLTLACEALQAAIGAEP